MTHNYHYDVWVVYKLSEIWRAASIFYSSLPIYSTSSTFHLLVRSSIHITCQLSTSVPCFFPHVPSHPKSLLAKVPLGMSYSFGAKAKGWDIFCNLLYNPSLPLSPSTWSIFPPFPIFLFNFTLD